MGPWVLISAGWYKASLEAVIEALDRSQAVIEFNMDGTIITANRNFLGAMGYALDEVQGRHHSMFVEPANKESAEYAEFWKSLNRGEFQTAEYKRLGKGGKGFAVVASEVKGLASQTAKATEEISSQINGVQKATKEAVDAIQAVSTIIGEINEITTAIASAVEEQSATAGEMSSNMQSAAEAVNSISSGINEIAQSARQVEESTNKVREASQAFG